MNKRGVGVSGYLAKLFVCLGIVSLSLSLSLISFNSVRAETTLSISTPSDPILEVSLSSNLVSLDLMPKQNSADLKSGSITVSVGTNNIYGYSLYMDVDNTSLTRTQAINNTTPVIASLADNAEGYTDSTFTANRWGYRTDNGNYFAIPSEETLLNSYDDMINQDSTTITFASKVDMSQPAGTYSTDVNLVAVVNPEPPVTLQNVDYWRGGLATDQAIQATDERDGKTYWVLKARDEHLWMTQNLDFDLNANKTYTPADTDITSNWTPTRSTVDTSNGTIPGWASDATTPFSVNPGDWYWNGVYYPYTDCGASYCNYIGGSPNGKFAQAPYELNGTHGHVGNYYNFSAAVAMNDTSSYNTSTFDNVANNPQTSICPAGWRLPTVSSVASKNEFQNLLTAYGVSGGDSKLVASPLYFVRDGAISSGTLQYAGYGGDYLTSTVSSSTQAYRFGSSSNGLWPAYSDNRDILRPVRCIAR